jgi:hypothetical protein
MDWQIVEVGIVTTLALWVFIFSPSSTSRLVAGIVFLANLIWVLIEPEQTPRRTSTRAHQSRHISGGGTATAEDVQAARVSTSGEATDEAADAQPPRRII